MSRSDASWLRNEAGKSSTLVLILLLAGAVGGVFWGMTFGADKLDFFSLQRELNENCIEAASKGSNQQMLQEMMQRDIDKHGIDYVIAEEAASIFTNVDGTTTCRLQYQRTVDYPFVEKSTTLLYTYGCRTNAKGNECMEVDPNADPY